MTHGLIYGTARQLGIISAARTLAPVLHERYLLASHIVHDYVHHDYQGVCKCRFLLPDAKHKT